MKLSFSRIIFILFAALLGFIFYTVQSTGFFREVAPTNLEVIASYALPGVEDLELIRKDSFLILSSDDRAARRNGELKNGGLYLLDLKTRPAAPRLLTEFLNRPFYPHGISMYPLSDSVYRLWAINHPSKNQHQIEVFDLYGDSLSFIKSISHRNLVSPNDLVALDSETFYITNDHGYTSGMGLLAEDYLGLAISNVSYFNGEEVTVVAEGISYANGVAFDGSRNLLYVASPRKFTIKVYAAMANRELEFIEDLFVGTGIDNLFINDDKSIWTGAHPNLLHFTSYAQGKKEFAPSEVLEITYETSGCWSQVQWFEDDGTTLSGASVAIPWGDEIFIGNVMDNKLITIPKK
ncbi:MAG: hypothetical protein ACO2ZZ_01155 [Cyclobacteriaceae bacterium]